MSAALRQLISVVRADWEANTGNVKGRIVLVLFRVAQAARGSGRRPRLLAVPIGVTYRVVVEWLLGIELPWKTRVGPGLRLLHGHALVVNDGSVIGRGVTLRHSTTIGRRPPVGACPRLGDRVDVGAGAILLGGISIGADARIGAGAVVLDDVPAGAVAFGNPAAVHPAGQAARPPAAR